MNKILTLCIGILLGSTNYLNAEQLLGINITYRNIGSLKYSVTYLVYTDKSDTSTFKPLVFKVISGAASVINQPKFVKTFTYKYGCEPDIKETFISTYLDTVDLDLSKYSSIKTSGNCRTYFTCKYLERYKNLKNIAPNSYFSYAFINTCNGASNTSPIFNYNNESTNLICINKAYDLGSSSADTTNYDSLVYTFSSPYSDLNSKINFQSGYSLSNQFDSYKPTGYSGPPIPESNPPIGIFLDSESGDLVFSPTDNSNYATTSELIEYRKIGNKYLEVGGILSDFVLRVVSDCPYNSPPRLIGKSKYEVEAGKQICFTIDSYDNTYIPPPPQKPAPPDTVRLTWNRAIPGATFTILDPKARLQSGKFCWTPASNQYNDLPFSVIITARDNGCPRNEKVDITYTIKVNKSVNSISKSNPQNIIISPNPSSNGQLTITSDNIKFNEIGLFDISGQLMANWNFEQTNYFSKDLSFLAHGIYIIQCKNGGEVFNFKWIRE